MQNVFTQSHAAILTVVNKLLFESWMFSFLFFYWRKKNLLNCVFCYHEGYGDFNEFTKASVPPSCNFKTVRLGASNLVPYFSFVVFFPGGVLRLCVAARLFHADQLQFEERHLVHQVQLLSLQRCPTHQLLGHETHANTRQVRWPQMTRLINNRQKQTHIHQTSRRRVVGMLLHFANVLPTLTEQTGPGAQTPLC